MNKPTFIAHFSRIFIAVVFIVSFFGLFPQQAKALGLCSEVLSAELSVTVKNASTNQVYGSVSNDDSDPEQSIVLTVPGGVVLKFEYSRFGEPSSASGGAYYSGQTTSGNGTYTASQALPGSGSNIGVFNAWSDNFCQADPGPAPLASIAVSVNIGGGGGCGASCNADLTVSTSSGYNGGTGVVSGTGGINCGGACFANFTAGTSVTLNATPSSGHTFGGWTTGPCVGQGSSCTFTINSDTTVNARFNYGIADIDCNGSDGPCTVPIGQTFTLSWSANPDHMNCNINPSPGGLYGSNGSRTITATTNVTYTISGCSGALYDDPSSYTSAAADSVTIIVSGGGGSPDFTLFCSPASQTIAPGASTSFNASVSPSGGFSGTVNMSVSISSLGGSNPAITSFSPTTQASPYNNPLSSAAIGTTGSTTAGTYTVSFTGTSGALNRGCSSQLVISGGAPGTPTATISANPTTVNTGGSTTLTWSSTNATSCTPSSSPVNAQWNGTATGLSGSTVISGLTQPTNNFTITCSGASSSTQVTVVPVSTYNISMSKTPAAGGTVTSTSVPTQTDFNCGTACSSQTLAFSAGSNVSVVATAAAGYVFTNWTGGCITISRTCNLNDVSADKSITANFAVDTGFGALLTITSITPNPADATATVAGTIRAAAKPSGTQCSGPTRTVYFPQDATATGWDSPSGPSGTYTITQTNAGVTGAIGGCAPVYVARQYSFSFVINTSTLAVGSHSVIVNATGYTGPFSATGSFNVSHNKSVTVTKAGTGSGTVTSSPSGINCGSGAGCTSNFIDGTSVTLTAAQAPGSSFTSWSGVAGCNTNPVCTFTLNANTNVTATFTTIACPSGAAADIQLSSSAINVTESAIAGAPVGFSGGNFASSNSSIASLSGTTITGAGGGQTTIINGATLWSHTNGAINCTLNPATITVRSFTTTLSTGTPSIYAGGTAIISVTILPVQSGNMPVVVSYPNIPSAPSGWSVSPLTPQTVYPNNSYPFTLSVTTNGAQQAFGLVFKSCFNSFCRNDTINITVGPPPPNAPTNVRMDNQSQCGKIVVTWGVPSGGSTATGYRVYRSKVAGAVPVLSNDNDWQQVSADLADTVFSYTDTPPGPFLTGSVYYAVSAFNAAGPGARATDPGAPYISVVACSLNFTGTDKDILAVNGTDLSPVPNPCNNKTESDATNFPDSFKAGDRIKFRVNVCNTNGTTDTTSLYLVDTLYHLTPVTTPTPGNFDYSIAKGCTKRAPEIISNNVINVYIQDLPAHDWCSFTFEALIAPPAQGSSIFDFQNTIEVYSGGVFQWQYPTSRFPSITAPFNPIKTERP